MEIIVRPLTGSLHQAIKDQDLEKVRKLLNAGANVNEEDDEGDTPLQIAIFIGNVEIVKLLLDHDADINNVNEVSALQFSLQWRSDLFELVRVLVFASANVNDACVDTGRTALHFAAMNNDVSFIHHLFSRGASVNRKDGDKQTPLHVVGSKEYNKTHVDSAKVLLINGADVNAINNDLQTPLQCAIDRGDFQVAKILVEAGSNIDSAGQSGETTLHLAVRKSDVSGVKELLLVALALMLLREKIKRPCTSQRISIGAKAIVK